VRWGQPLTREGRLIAIVIVISLCLINAAIWGGGVAALLGMDNPPSLALHWLTEELQMSPQFPFVHHVWPL
jgi:hypothetical protein